MIATVFLFLQAATFQSYVDEARVKLGLVEPITVEVYQKMEETPDGHLAAWTPWSKPRRIMVWNETLAQASLDAQRVIAYHEACHHFLAVQEKQATDKFQVDLVHELQRLCTIRTLGRDLEKIMRRVSLESYGSRLSTVKWWRRRCR